MISFEHVTKVYTPGAAPAVDDLTLEVPQGATVTLIGTSGSGKSTALRMINRLIVPTSGRILLDGADVTTLDVQDLRRSIGYAIQGVGLFPHWTVAENIGTVPWLLKWDRARIAARVEELLDLVGLEPGVYGAKYPDELSGGEAQRVGVARALAADPPVLLMDEPFGAVDPLTRDKLQTEFVKIQERLHKTVVFVTHDLDEAIKLADRIAIMRAGRVIQYDVPERVIAYPADEFVAEFVGSERSLKRLGLGRVTEAMVPVSAAADDAPTVEETATLRSALALILERGVPAVRVVRADGTVAGMVTIADIVARFGKALA